MMKEMKASEQAALEHAKLQNEKLFDENQNLKLVNLNLQHEVSITRSMLNNQCCADLCTSVRYSEVYM